MQAPAAPPAVARRSTRERAKPVRFDPGAAIVIGTSAAPEGAGVVTDGHALAVDGQHVPKSYADIANFGDMQGMWYASLNRELANITNLKVVSEVFVRCAY